MIVGFAAFSLLLSAGLSARGGRMGAIAALSLAVVGGSLIALDIGLRWGELGRPPFKTLEETLVLLAFLVLAAGGISARWGKAGILQAAGATTSAALLGWAAISSGTGTLTLPPALHSPFFVPHVTIYLAGYGLLLLSTIAAVASLIRRKEEYLPDRLALAAVVFLTAGLCLGALWADRAWGSWWSWDAKESMALASWLVLAAHRHLSPQERRSRTGLFLILIAAVLTLFTYLFIHLLPAADTSMHVYSRT